MKPRLTSARGMTVQDDEIYFFGRAVTTSDWLCFWHSHPAYLCVTQCMVRPTLINRSQPASWRASASISADKRSMRSSSRRQSPADSSKLCHVRRKVRGGSAENARQLGAQKALPLSHSESTLQRKGADLIDDAGVILTLIGGTRVAMSSPY
jgi:hypothetical protein